METAILNVRIDKDVKREFEAVCEAIGLSMGAAVNIFVRRMAAERRIPFEVSVPEPDKKAMFIEAADKASAWARENGLTEDDLANELKALRAERNA